MQTAPQGADPLALQQHGVAVAMYAYWEARYRAHPGHPPTVEARNAWRGVVRAMERYYGLPSSFENHRERKGAA